MLTKEQEEKRMGRFTGSSIYKLIPGGRRDMTDYELRIEKESGGKRKTVDILFGETAMTYIYEKAAEVLTGERKDFKPTFEMIRGSELEAEAKKYLSAAMGIEVKDVDTENDEHTAWSIDGYVDAFGCGIEILCPNSDNHLRYLLGDKMEIKKNYPTKYWQMTFYAWKYNVDFWKFISFDPRFKKPENKMLVFNFEIDIKDRNFMIMKLQEAIKIKEEIVKKLS